MIVGIDLGTTYSTVARINSKGIPEAIKNSYGSVITPSVVAFTKDGIVCGEEAKENQAMGFNGSVSTFKRNMGEEGFLYSEDGKEYSAEDLSALLMKHLIEDAEKATGEKVEAAVITCPAYFTDKERAPTIRAGERCGIKVLCTINEPTAATVFYGVGKNSKARIMTYDLGGGTFDVTIAEVNNNNVNVVGTTGDHFLGGKDWDEALIEFIAEKFEESHGVDIHDEPYAWNEILIESENFKKALTTMDKASINVRSNEGSDKYVITRNEFEEMTSHLVNKTLDLCESLLKELNFTWKDIDNILLVGGSTKMPAIAKALEFRSGKKPMADSEREYAVALGAAIFAQNISETCVDDQYALPSNVSDVAAHSLGALSTNKEFTAYVNSKMIMRNSKIPTSVKKTFEIQPGNYTDLIEIYTLQGESTEPIQCLVLAKVTASGIENDGGGTKVDIEFIYNRSGIVEVRAYQNENSLKITEEKSLGDTSWMNRPPEKPKAVIRIKKNIIIALDVSGSMCGSPMEKAGDSILKFVNILKGSDFTLLAFSDKNNVVVSRSKLENPEKYVRMLKGTDCGICNMANPLDLVKKYIEPGYENIVLILTDGVWCNKACSDAISDSKEMRKKEIKIIAIGFGSADEVFLRKISTSTEDGISTNINDLENTMFKIATQISTSNSLKG